MGILNESELRRPAGADAARVLATGMVGWFHIWQQSWVGAGQVDFLPRTGYLWVDMFMLLSGFCLTLPYAADAACGLPFRGTAGFYRRRLLRILPEYWLCLAVHLAVALGLYGPSMQLARDLAAHLTLTQTLFFGSYYATLLGPALWSVGALAGFYLVFPLLIRGLAFRPGLTLGGLCAVQLAYGLWVWRQDDLFRMCFNQLPAFAAVFALGMAAALVYVRLRPVCGRWHWLALAAVPLLLGSMVPLLRRQVWAEEVQRAQFALRLPMALLFTGLLLALCLGLGASRRGRPLAVLAGASYGFYLWHQSIAVWLKQLRIPHWTGDTPPNMTGDRIWMEKYNLLCWFAALAAAFVSAWTAKKLAGIVQTGWKRAKTA